MLSNKFYGRGRKLKYGNRIRALLIMSALTFLLWYFMVEIVFIIGTIGTVALTIYLTLKATEAWDKAENKDLDIK